MRRWHVRSRLHFEMQARPSRPSSTRRVLTTGSSRVGRNARTNFDGSGHSSAADFQNSRYAEVRPPSESRTNHSEIVPNSQPRINRSRLTLICLRSSPRAARLSQILDPLAEDSWLNVYAGELEVR